MSDFDEKPEQKKRVTAQMVADAAGVSRSAVSRAFTDGAYLDSEKRVRIRQVALELGYQPNALAAGLQGGRSHLVAIFVGNMRSPYDTAFVGHLVGRLNALGKWPILIDGSGAQASTAVEDVLRYPLDAMILRGGSMPEDLVLQCAKIGIPMISSGRPVDIDGVDNVCCRNADGTRSMTEFLIAQGRKKFAYISAPRAYYSSTQRRNGVVQALAQAGRELMAEEDGDFTVDGGFDAGMRLLSNHRPDALICANDATAIGALTAAKEMGWQVPDQIAIVGFDDIDMARWPSFDLTTVMNPIDRSVDAIIELLNRRLETPEKSNEMILVKTELVLRGTH
ncbi:DNA-binding transcriptional regulator, LacI/PurR family [Aliiroseovarius halocynthiae]|uniref:LacI family transcriptional regulator n=1 Tax=Aliiroseovarius halocynthiae TaxID=985055 RepID=A0A545SNY7_9RHOB|nr:substrate-binding domain-containing protein [Aliiroseovarius halocynthiae]TQV66667.1 LacI family transcriptional regulator [Aliiroseovarius halocynthiae]SMR82455.1 DNA-binding transcriptional regulator, LacI/PurR family [Aliiroseovarius halocynthiae]